VTRPSKAEAAIPFAWAYWFAWKGPLELVVRIARAAVDAAEKGGNEPRCEIKMRIDEDVEVFGSPEEFETQATRSGLRFFHHLEITVGESDRHVAVLFAKRGHPFVDRGPERAPWLQRGVLVQALAPSEGTQEDARRIRDAVVKAVARGAEEAPMQGETWNGSDAQEEIGEALHQRTRVSRGDRLSWAAFTPAFAFVLLTLNFERGHDFVFKKVPRAPDSSSYDIGVGWEAGVVLVAGVLVGYRLAAPLARFVSASIMPAVAIQEFGSATTRAFRYVRGHAVNLLTVGALLYLWQARGRL
jgi:hypothetical protein